MPFAGYFGTVPKVQGKREDKFIALPIGVARTLLPAPFLVWAFFVWPIVYRPQLFFPSRLKLLRRRVGKLEARGGHGPIDFPQRPPPGERKARMHWRADPGFATQISTLAFPPDGRTLAVGDLTTVRLYDVASGRERVWFVAVADQPRWVRCLAFSPDGKQLAGALGYGPGPHLKLWEVETLIAAPAGAGR
jgi:hypothetical protein